MSRYVVGIPGEPRFTSRIKVVRIQGNSGRGGTDRVELEQSAETETTLGCIVVIGIIIMWSKGLWRGYFRKHTGHNNTSWAKWGRFRWKSFNTEGVRKELGETVLIVIGRGCASFISFLFFSFLFLKLSIAIL